MIDTSKCPENGANNDCYTYNQITTELDLSIKFPKQIYTISSQTTSTSQGENGIYVDEYCSFPPARLNELINITSTNLQILKLNNINFYNYTPNDITFDKDLPSLERFEITAPSKIKLTSIKEDVLIKFLIKMKNIKTLNLNRVNMGTFSGSIFTSTAVQLNNLENIILDNTNITDANINKLLLKTNNIKALHLNNTTKNMYSVNQFTFPTLVNLEYFSLSNDTTTSSSITINVLYKLLNNMPNIKYLNIIGNNDLGLTNTKLNNLMKLEKLYLDNTNISQKYLNEILNMAPSLKLLSLSNNNFKQYETSNAFPELQNLKELYLNNMTISSMSIIIELLKKTPNINKLTLNRNVFDASNIKNIGEIISELNNLKQIELDIIDNNTKSIAPDVLDEQIKSIVYPNDNITSILLSISDKYNYGKLAFRKYEKVLLNTYEKKQDGTNSNYGIENITDKINSLYDPNKNNTKIVLIIICVFIITGSLYAGYKLYKTFQNM